MLEGLCLLGIGSLPNLSSADLVDGVARQPLDVEAVEDLLRLWRVRGHRVDERGAHVHRHVGELLRALRSKQGEELREALGALALALTQLGRQLASEREKGFEPGRMGTHNLAAAHGFPPQPPVPTRVSVQARVLPSPPGSSGFL